MQTNEHTCPKKGLVVRRPKSKPYELEIANTMSYTQNAFLLNRKK